MFRKLVGIREAEPHVVFTPRRTRAALDSSRRLHGEAKPGADPGSKLSSLLTGPDKRAAEDARRGLLLAVEDINAKENRVGGRPVVVRTVDTRDDGELVQAELCGW